MNTGNQDSNRKSMQIEFEMQNIAAAHGKAENGAVTVRSFPRRNRMINQSAHRFIWYINGNRTSKNNALRFLTA